MIERKVFKKRFDFFIETKYSLYYFGTIKI